MASRSRPSPLEIIVIIKTSLSAFLGMILCLHPIKSELNGQGLCPLGVYNQKQVM